MKDVSVLSLAEAKIVASTGEFLDVLGTCLVESESRIKQSTEIDRCMSSFFLLHHIFMAAILVAAFSAALLFVSQGLLYQLSLAVDK
jgi:hypothetical protein